MAKPRRAMKRKNMLMDQYKLDVAREVLGTASETATVDEALDLIVFRKEVFEGLHRLAAAGGLESFDSARRKG